MSFIHTMTEVQLNTNRPDEGTVSTLVSVIVVTYNSRPYLDACLSSLQQTLPDHSEIVVLDNASTDGTADYIAEHYPDVKLIANPDNLGFAAGNNLAVSYASGDYFAFINPDTQVEAGWLEPMLKLFEQDPTIGLITPKILLMQDHERVNTCGNNVHLTGLALCRGINKSSSDPELAEAIPVNAISGAAFMIRRELFLTLGGFDELMFMYMEDTDLSMRARLAGYHSFYTPDSVIYHDYRLRFGTKKTFYQERNRYIMLLKLLRWRTLLLMLPTFLFSEAVTWGFIITKDRRNIANKPHAYRSVLDLWGQIMSSRREMQARRRISDREMLEELHFRLEFEQTGDDFVTKLAHLIFDPIFWLMQYVLLIVSW